MSTETLTFFEQFQINFTGINTALIQQYAEALQEAFNQQRKFRQGEILKALKLFYEKVTRYANYEVVAARELIL